MLFRGSKLAATFKKNYPPHRCMSDLIREPDELWTSYAIRRLEQEGMIFTPWKAQSNYRDASSHRVNFSTIGQVSERLDVHISKEVLVPPSAAERRFYRGTMAEIALLEGINVLLPESTDPSVSFCFNSRDKVSIENHEGAELQKYFNCRYQEGCYYDPSKVIDDIVSYVQRFKPTLGFPGPTPSGGTAGEGEAASPARLSRGRLWLLRGNYRDGLK